MSCLSTSIVKPTVPSSPSLEYFNEYAEQLEGGQTSSALSEAAKKNKVYLIGGSFPERKDGKLYNTCTVWGPDGGLLAVHRKVLPILNRACNKQSDYLLIVDLDAPV